MLHYILGYAAYVCCTRLTNYKHSPADVVTGAIIGTAAAMACRPHGIVAWWVREVI